jgi:ATP-dependent RNA circularization protein (DNA/RNA ligase family)
MKNPRYKKHEDMAEVWERLANDRRQGIVEKTPDADVA